MKKTLLALAALSVFAVQAEPLKVAATPVPHAEILEFLKPALAEQGVELDIKVFTDYVQPNVQVAEKRLDANFFSTSRIWMSLIRPKARPWSVSLVCTLNHLVPIPAQLNSWMI